MTAHRIGLIVPSSNVTVETEVPALLARHADARFSFHSSRMRMHTVSPEELRAMNAQLISPAEEEFGLPVVSAATAGAYTLLRHLGLPAVLPGAGLLLAAEQPAGSGPPGAARAAGPALQSPS